MAKTLITAIPIPPGQDGPEGPRGPQGLPGVNAVPADQAVATYLGTPGSAARAVMQLAVAELGGGPGGGGPVLIPSTDEGFFDIVVGAQFYEDPNDEGTFLTGGIA